MATRTISTKLQLDGEAEYRASLKNINSELGTLKSELKLTESQFAGHLNSYAALSAKGETLAGMYDQQEKKLAAYLLSIYRGSVYSISRIDVFVKSFFYFAAVLNPAARP